MKRQSVLYALIVAVALAGIGCGKISVKQNLVMASSVTETSLGAAQDFEKATFAAGSIPALTPAVHKDISAALEKAFAAQVTSATALIAWKAGDPVPSSVAELTADASAALALVQKLSPAGGAVADLVAKIQAAVNEANTLAAAFQNAK